MAVAFQSVVPTNLFFQATIVENVKRVAAILADTDQEKEQTPTGDVLATLLKTSLLFKHTSTSEDLEIFETFFAKDLFHSDLLAQLSS